jgi:hypothetical protein
MSWEAHQKEPAPCTLGADPDVADPGDVASGEAD